MGAVKEALALGLDRLEEIGRADAAVGETKQSSSLWKLLPDLFDEAPEREFQLMLRRAYRDGRGDPLPLAVHVPEPFEYLDRGLATASWWNSYTIRPGFYLIGFENSQGLPLPGNTLADAHDYCDKLRAEQQLYWWPQYGRATLRAVLNRSYRENRVLWEARSQTDSPGKPGTVLWHPYGYEVKPGTVAFGEYDCGRLVKAHATVVEVPACDGCGATARDLHDLECTVTDGVAANAGSVQ